MEEKKSKTHTGEHALARWHESPTWHRRSLLALRNAQLIEADALRTVTGRKNIRLLPAMGNEALCCIEIHRLLQYGISTFSEASPSRKTPTLISLIASPEGATHNVSYLRGNLAIKEVLPGNRDVVLKLSNNADKRTCINFVGHRRRLLPRAECDLLVEMGVKDTASLCNTMQAPSTVQGARCQTAVASRATRRLLIYRQRSSQQLITPGVKTGVSPNRQVVECGDVPSAEYSLCLLCSRPLIHPRDTLLCVLAMLNCITTEVNIDTDGIAITTQLRLEATRETVYTLPSPTEGQEAAADSGPICTKAIAWRVRPAQSSPKYRRARTEWRTMTSGRASHLVQYRTCAGCLHEMHPVSAVVAEQPQALQGTYCDLDCVWFVEYGCGCRRYL